MKYAVAVTVGLMVAAILDIVAAAVSLWWGPVVVVAPFALSWAAGAALALWAIRKPSVAWVAGAFVATALGALEPLGGILASFSLHEPPGAGAVVPAVLAGVSLASLAAVATLTSRAAPAGSRRDP